MATKKASRRGGKSTAIRAYLETHPGAGPKEIVTALAENGVKVTSALVSNVKARLAKTGVSTKKRGRPARVNVEMIAVTSLVEAKKFASSLGSIAAARQALDTLSRISL
jgi:predicted phosphoribosyltransferase